MIVDICEAYSCEIKCSIFISLIFCYIYIYIYADIEKTEKNNFLLQNDQFLTKAVEIFRKHVF